jgi:hypothetical protein
MRLLTLKLQARGVNGWESPTLEFGRRLTSLFAPNGSGKTPIVQALAFCLGFDTKFRDDIREKCEAVVLTVQHRGSDLTIRRTITTDFHASIDAGDRRREFFSEGDLSRVLFEELGMTVPALVGTNRQLTRPYVSTVLPLFYVRQDGGYNEPYRAPATFIASQFVEMVRFAFGLSPRHSYNARRELLEAREQLDALQRRVVSQQKVVADLGADSDDSAEAYQLLVGQTADLTSRLNELKESVDAQGAANDALAELLQAKEEQIRKARREQGDLRARIAGIESIRAEIEGEIRTLSLNEESKRAFETFFDICGRPDCGLFISSTESYGKNLLYLKDQIKDLERNAGRTETQLAVLDARLADHEAERQAIASKLTRPDRQNAASQIVLAVQSLTRQLMETEQLRAAVDQLKEQRWKLVKLEDERSRLQDRIAMLADNGRADLEFNKLRLRIRELTVKWMDVLNTPNVSRDIEIDLDFRFKFGHEPVDIIGGSTKSRLILAIHAALFEHYLEQADRPFRFLILDTPKQQELSSDDLKRFLDALCLVCDEHSGQVLISASEYRHAIRDGDKEWLPTYDGVDKKMYLGSPKSDA